MRLGHRQVGEAVGGAGVVTAQAVALRRLLGLRVGAGRTIVAVAVGWTTFGLVGRRHPELPKLAATSSTAPPKRSPATTDSPYVAVYVAPPGRCQSERATDEVEAPWGYPRCPVERESGCVQL